MGYQNTIVAEWWNYDIEIATLYYEEMGTPGLQKVHTSLFSSSQIEDAWMGVSEEGKNILLWNDKELSPGNNLVAEVVNWNLRAIHEGNVLERFTFGIYCAVIAGRLTWTWEEGFPNVSLCGHYRDGGYFEDPVRLLIPLETGGLIALGKARNRQYYVKSV